MPNEAAPRPILTFGRRRGRKLRASRQELVDTLLPRISIRLPESGATVSPAIFFDRSYEQYWLEIGFGGGEHLVAQAERYPHVGMLGCEPYINGLSHLLVQVQEKNLSNLRILADDARPLVARLENASLARIFILFPDPWPKSRHHKRRLIAAPFITELARVLKPGGELRIVTDHEDYLTWILEHMLASEHFQWTAKTCADWTQPPPDWVVTRYQQKALAGQASYLRFLRK